MDETVVLRFANNENRDTVREHEAVAAEHGSVWWGWWKKASEPYPHDDLERFAKSVPLRVGLLNRQDRLFYEARCTRVELTPHGRRASPDSKRTPNYYSSDEFPAWFALDTFKVLDEAAWEELFGAIPEGEPTLFFADGRASAASSWRIDSDSVQPTKIRSSRILHISDTHFGSDHGFPLISSEVAVPAQKSLAKQIAMGLDSSGVTDVGLVVFSGDLTTRGEDRGLIQAERFIKELMGRLDLSHEHIVVVPGNHDILLDEDEVTRNYDADVPFRRVLQILHGNDPSELNRVLWFAPPAGPELIVLALNSVRPRSATDKDYGYVGQDYYAPLLREAAEILQQSTRRNGQRPLQIAVLHHHVLPAALVEEPDKARPVSLTLDAGQLIHDLQEAGFNLILHGHQHVPFVGSTSRMRNVGGKSELSNPVYVIGSGSSGAGVSRLWNVMRYNSVGVLDYRHPEVEVTILQFAPGKPFEPFAQITLPISV